MRDSVRESEKIHIVLRSTKLVERFVAYTVHAQMIVSRSMRA